jgi:hypothetical protein
MRLGVYLRELWGHKLGLALSVVIAVVATTQIVYGISLSPPGIEGNSLNVASASTHVIVDTPKSTVVDPRSDVYTIESQSNRAVILGNVMASLPVRQYIARRAGISADQIRAEPPVTPDQPRAMVDSAHAPRVSDILKRPDEYRLSIQADPMAPVLDIYTVAPTTDEATKLADASVDGLRDYLGSVAAKDRTPKLDQVRLEQLGRATGGTINAGAGMQIAILTFLLVFAIACLGVLFLARVRRGWELAANGHMSPPHEAS